MRYRICKNIIIRSENAAKPLGQKSLFLIDTLSRMPIVKYAVDYGCGKLRYLDEMSGRCEELLVVDSEIQLSRTQKIHGQSTTIKQFLSKFNNIDSKNVQEFIVDDRKYERAFCINMLSVVPILSVRKRILKIIFNKLNSGGICLFVTQYRNSEFTKMLSNPNAMRYEDGILIKGIRGYTFYGLINAENLINLVTNCGFLIMEKRLNEGSVYLLCVKP